MATDVKQCAKAYVESTNASDEACAETWAAKALAAAQAGRREMAFFDDQPGFRPENGVCDALRRRGFVVVTNAHGYWVLMGWA